jgi:MFS family permease
VIALGAQKTDSFTLLSAHTISVTSFHTGDLLVQNGWLLFNNICALIGYYCAARVIDVPGIGRKKLQMASFAICAALFMTTAAIFDTARSETLMFLYFASSFFGNFGVNVTTYVVAAETYPAELRATCHGLSAFMGKLGALLATILFDRMSTAEIFWCCGTVSIIGLIVTFIFTVDLTHVSLAELDAQLELFLEGKLARYKGKLNAPQHLSNFEIWTGRHGEYDPLWATKLLGESSRHRRRRTLSARSAASLIDLLPEDDSVVDGNDSAGLSTHTQCSYVDH